MLRYFLRCLEDLNGRPRQVCDAPYMNTARNNIKIKISATPLRSKSEIVRQIELGAGEGTEPTAACKTLVRAQGRPKHDLNSTQMPRTCAKHRNTKRDIFCKRMKKMTMMKTKSGKQQLTRYFRNRPLSAQGFHREP